MSIKVCPKCHTEHYKTGKFCSRKCANSRGPRTDDFKKTVSEKLTGKSMHTEESIRKSILSRGRIPNSDRPDTSCVICGTNTNTKHRKTCSEICYKKLTRLNSQKNPKCGGQKHTHRTKIQNINGEIFVSESSYEVRLAEILNSLDILWIRPECFWYVDSKENKRRYYPDFYLPAHDIYIDPKNDYLIKTDIDKINCAAKQNNVRIVILGIDYLTKDTIVKLVGNRGTAPLLPACKAGTLLLS